MLFFALLALAVIPAPVFAKNIQLAWDANSPSSETAGYRVYYSQVRGEYNRGHMKDVGNATRFAIDLPDGKWYFVVTAYDSRGEESGYSVEISWPDGGISQIQNIPKPKPKPKPKPPAPPPNSGSKAPDLPHPDANPARQLIPPSAHREYLLKPNPDTPGTSVPPKAGHP